MPGLRGTAFCWKQIIRGRDTHFPLPTCAVCFGHQQHGVEDLILVLFVQDFALAEVGRELCRGDGATQFVTFALHLLPQRLHILRGPVLHLWRPETVSFSIIFTAKSKRCPLCLSMIPKCRLWLFSCVIFKWWVRKMEQQRNFLMVLRKHQLPSCYLPVVTCLHDWSKKLALRNHFTAICSFLAVFLFLLQRKVTQAITGTHLKTVILKHDVDGFFLINLFFFLHSPLPQSVL